MENTKKYTYEELDQLTIFELRERARKIGVASPTSKSKEELIKAYISVESGDITPAQKQNRGRPPKSSISSLDDEENYTSNIQEPYSEFNTTADQMPTQTQTTVVNTPIQNNAIGSCERKSGWLEILPEGYGFLRAENCEYSIKDTYVSGRSIKEFGLRAGDMVCAVARKNADNKPPAVVSVESVNGMPLSAIKNRPNFDMLVPIYPNKRLELEVPNSNNDYSIRCMDIVAPIGKGQRAMIVSPPKAGKTTLLKKIAKSIVTNHPEVELYVLLVDERPEEVTDMKRSIKGEIVYSTFDETPEHHCKAAELIIERAKRSVEIGRDVVIIMDSLTRLARAYNLTIPATGRTLSGGIDPGALHSPKKFFGSARNIENGGSLTIIATALVDTGSRMDDVIYEEFKGTGNMEIHLDRKLSERRIFPAVDLFRSSTRRDDLLLTPKEMECAMAIRRLLSSGDVADSTERLINMLVRTKNNDEFCDNMIMEMRAFEKEGYNFRK